jgi:homoserine O-acetyltransferase/O-succinyltransferase
VLIDAIRSDAGWKNGDYVEQPPGLATAVGILGLMLESPVQLQKELPTRQVADDELRRYVASELKRRDANDVLYAFEASEDYDASPHLAKIEAPLIAVNFADDEINPSELPMLRTLIGRVKRPQKNEINSPSEFGINLVAPLTIK